MYRKYLREIEAKENVMGTQCSAPASLRTENADPPQNTTIQNSGALEIQNTSQNEGHTSGPSTAQNPDNLVSQGATPPQNDTQNPGPSTAAPAKKQLTPEEEKKRKEFIEHQKRELDKLLEMATNTEMMIFKSFPFQEAIICGNFNANFPNTTKTIRIFTSSTFTDTKYERNSWMAKAYPKIKEHCFKKGYEFQVVDMRWGVRQQATDDHMTTELCMHELHQCQQISKGPSFISLFAHKYGYRSLLRVINADEFLKIQSQIKEPEDLKLMARWYEQDKNAVPEVFVLKPISRNIPDFLSKDFDKQSAGKTQFWNESEKLMAIISRGATLGLDEVEATKYKMSVTEMETETGLKERAINKKCFWFRKKFRDIENQEPSYTLSRYIECLGDEKVWKTARERNKALQKRMEEKINPDNIYTYELNWTEKGIDPNNKEHAEYLEQITEDFQTQMIVSIDEAIKEKESNKKLSLKPEREEFLRHAALVEEKSSGIRGRDEIVKKIKDYVLGDSKEVLVVHGESGCGKTSVMALAAKQAFQWIRGNGMVLVRFLGSTQESSNLLTLLQSMISQIHQYFKLPEVKSQDLQVLVKKFQTSLRFFILKKKKVVLFIDSIDQLESAHNGRVVSSWIPKNLIKDTKVIISTLDQPEFGVFPDIKTLSAEENFIQVPLLTSSDREDILDHFCQTSNRTLTDAQRTYVLEMFEKCPLPLFIKLSFREAMEWTSFRSIKECCLQDTIRGCIDQLFQKMETKYGRIFVSRTLGYITAAKHGLSEFELEDILSCDDDVLNDVYQFWTPPIRRLPPLLIVRLRYDLRWYLVSRGDSGIQILSWYHRQFWEAAENRYTKDESTRLQLHTGLADYFLGRWAGNTPKPFQDKNGKAEEIRYVASQPVQLGNQINERKMKNLPYHLAKSKNLKDLKKHCLLNFDFLIHKLLCLQTEDLLDDFALARSLFPAETDLEMLSQAINLSSAALSLDPRQLPSHLLDRLENSECHKDLLAQCQQSMYPYIVCSHSLLKKPGGQLIRTLTGHTTTVTSLDLHLYPSGQLVALSGSSSDNIIKTWDVHTGKEIKSGSTMQLDMYNAAFAADGQIIVQIFKNAIICCSSQWELKYTLKLKQNVGVTFAGKTNSTIAAIDTDELILWDALTGEEIRRKTTPSKFEKSYGMELLRGSENYVAFTSNLMENLCVYNIKDDLFSPVVNMGEDKDIITMAISSDETQIVTARGINELAIFEISTLQLLRTSKALENFHLLNSMHSKNDSILTCDQNFVLILDKTGSDVSSHFHHAVSLEDVKTCDMKIFVTRTQDKIIRVWDLEKKDVQNKLPEQVNRISEIIPMKNTRYTILHRTLKDGPSLFEVYDLQRDKVVKTITMDCKVGDITLLDDSSLLLVNSNDKIIKISLDTVSVATEFEGLIPAANSDLRLFNGGKELVVQTRGRINLKCYDVESGKVTKIIPCSTKEKSSPIDMIAASRDGHIVTCITEDERFLVCDAEKKRIIKTITKKDLGSKARETGLDIAVSTRGNYVIGSLQLAAAKETLTTPFVWKKEDDEITVLFDDNDLKQYIEQGKDVYGFEMNTMVFVKDELLAVAYQDGVIRLWDVAQGTVHMKLSGHTDIVEVYGNPYGPYMMSYCDMEETNLMRIWDINSWECLASYRPEAFFRKVTPASDGKSFLAELDQNLVHFTLNEFDKNDLEMQKLINESDDTEFRLQVLGDNDKTVSPDDPDQEDEEPEETFSDDEDDDDDN
ncbi:NACHT and WD repeat domain-containing protein 2-like [Saccostrea echinata]|uniref:NACHT and WD repeat domain-containing protein 2-like n=1 Tax=Saccostrea echinata TaxID=191078 RepID=UPI002A8222C5|nr:NACHT and WD repeat domain-containing protein 2-like [Saccostrea echinata]